jgi:hypothetical protein
MLRIVEWVRENVAKCGMSLPQELPAHIQKGIEDKLMEAVQRDAQTACDEAQA